MTKVCICFTGYSGNKCKIYLLLPNVLMIMEKLSWQNCEYTISDTCNINAIFISYGGRCYCKTGYKGDNCDECVTNYKKIIIIMCTRRMYWWLLNNNDKHQVKNRWCSCSSCNTGFTEIHVILNLIVLLMELIIQNL